MRNELAGNTERRVLSLVPNNSELRTYNSELGKAGVSAKENQIRFSRNHFRFRQNVYRTTRYAEKLFLKPPNIHPVLSFRVFCQSIVSAAALRPTTCFTTGQSRSRGS